MSKWRLFLPLTESFAAISDSCLLHVDFSESLKWGINSSATAWSRRWWYSGIPMPHNQLILRTSKISTCITPPWPRNSSLHLTQIDHDQGLCVTSLGFSIKLQSSPMRTMPVWPRSFQWSVKTHMIEQYNKEADTASLAPKMLDVLRSIHCSIVFWPCTWTHDLKTLGSND